MIMKVKFKYLGSVYISHLIMDKLHLPVIYILQEGALKACAIIYCYLQITTLHYSKIRDLM